MFRLRVMRWASPVDAKPESPPKAKAGWVQGLSRALGRTVAPSGSSEGVTPSATPTPLSGPPGVDTGATGSDEPRSVFVGGSYLIGCSMRRLAGVDEGSCPEGMRGGGQRGRWDCGGEADGDNDRQNTHNTALTKPHPPFHVISSAPPSPATHGHNLTEMAVGVIPDLESGVVPSERPGTGTGVRGHQAPTGAGGDEPRVGR
jgi:hypothetical protein